MCWMTEKHTPVLHLFGSEVRAVWPPSCISLITQFHCISSFGHVGYPAKFMTGSKGEFTIMAGHLVGSLLPCFTQFPRIPSQKTQHLFSSSTCQYKAMLLGCQWVTCPQKESQRNSDSVQSKAPPTHPTPPHPMPLLGKSFSHIPS